MTDRFYCFWFRYYVSLLNGIHLIGPPSSSHCSKAYLPGRYAPTIILLMGIKMSFTKNPMKPITMKPQAVLNATFVNSVNSK